MNNDLISREALKKHKVYSLERHEYVVPVYNIDNAPTIDMNTELSVAYLKGRRQGQSEQRPQGEWIGDTDYESYQGNYEAYKCNKCGYGLHWRDYYDSSVAKNFCPNCGAKMKGVRKND